MMLAIILIVISFGCIALYSIARHNALGTWASAQIVAVGGASGLAVAAAFVLFGEPPPTSSADASSSIASSSVASSSVASSSGATGSAAPRPPFGVMPLAQAKRLRLAGRRADGGIDNFGSATYDSALHQLRVEPDKPFTISGWAANVPTANSWKPARTASIASTLPTTSSFRNSVTAASARKFRRCGGAVTPSA
jgi:hypothetical protein